MDRSLNSDVFQNIRIASRVARCIVVAGRRQHDRFLLGASEDGTQAEAQKLRIVSLETLLHEAVGSTASWRYEPAVDRAELTHLEGNRLDQVSPLPREKHGQATIPVTDILPAFLRVAPPAGEHFLLVVNAALLFQTPEALQSDHALKQVLEFLSRETGPRKTLMLRVEASSTLPTALTSSPFVKIVRLPPVSREERYRYATLRCSALAQRCGQPLDDLAKQLAAETEDWTLTQLDHLIREADERSICASVDVEELIRVVRIGVTHSPWSSSQLRDILSNAEAELGRRIKGQPAAVGRVARALRAAGNGLAGAFDGRDSRRPRATLLLAGSTGTGKTEMARAIAELVFGDETRILRVDCGEYGEPHSIARLIGSPPGYVGYDAGGYLTQGLLQTPQSVVLLDELEKAHPKVLDTLLGVIDEGRLTSGQGETVYFSETILLFTTNLGVTRETPRGREPVYDFNTSFEEIESRVREAIDFEFSQKLNRPELLGRLGGRRAVVVFDFLRDPAPVAEKFLRNFAEAVRRNHDVTLEFDPSLIAEIDRAARANENILRFGGRGIRQCAEDLLMAPADDYLRTRSAKPGQVVRAAWRDGEVVFSERHLEIVGSG